MSQTALLCWGQNRENQQGTEKVELHLVLYQEKAFLFVCFWYTPNVFQPPGSFLLYFNQWIMNVKILFVKELRVGINFWISCSVLTDVSGEEMTICMFYASK